MYGDPHGTPLFYFHGWPVSRLSGKVYDSLAKQMHIRIISPDRPGFGLSEYKADRTLLDWPDDVVTIADHLHIRKFAIMGVSGGGPYAAVCAYKIPKRLTRVGIVVGLGVVRGFASLSGVKFVGQLGWLTFGKSSIIRSVSSLCQMIAARSAVLFRLTRYLWGKQDRRLLEDTELYMRAAETQKEAFRSGYRGAAHDLKLYCSDWGFDCADIRVPTFLWYGECDQNVSLAMGRRYHADITGSRLTIYPGEGHLISITHAKEILRSLTAK
jgi:pimeloyl-ACP methyl ester carboxylesterase